MGSRTIPGHYGARASRMGRALLNPTHQAAKTKGIITDEDFRRVVLWLDCNSARFGTVHSQKLVDDQKRGEIVFPVMDFGPWNPLGLEIYSGDKTPPSTVRELRVKPQGEGKAVQLTWKPAQDHESGIGCYAVYRDGEFYRHVLKASMIDGEPAKEKHVYEVAAVNLGGLEGSKSRE